MEKLSLSVRVAHTLLLLSLLPASCKQDDPNVGHLTVQLNGEKWSSKNVQYDKDSTPGIDRVRVCLGVYKKNGELTESEGGSFIYMMKSIGRQNIVLNARDLSQAERKPGMGFATAVVETEVTCAFYEVDTTATDNYIELTEIDDDKGIVCGEFSVTMHALYNCEGRLPDTLRFRKGSFRARKEER